MRKLIIASAILASVSAQAQQVTPEQSAAMQMGQQIGLLMHDNAVLRAQVQQLQQQLAAVKAKALEPRPPNPELPAK